MKEKAHIFFALLNESYKLGALEKLEAITIESSPHMKKQDRSDLIKGYKVLSKDKSDYLENNDYTNLDRLRIKL